ncbi:hypothetical protein [Agromyces archimandritae]|uniref:Fe-S oxidoreductase n=1 Tax=Agromyces archimandritae TaxID=2781962 RepID=A0A975FM65_9MICO|nr:hypothetical protein [Agromyces archimandritae]QTX04675.1 hypothetical protein G127AT_15750 [Agromyces archimandritae]
MQLGTRWPFGQEPPARVPAELREAIVAHEREAAAAGSWTLTWLEGRAIVEADDGTVVRMPGAAHPASGAEDDGDW